MPAMFDPWTWTPDPVGPVGLELQDVIITGAETLPDVIARVRYLAIEMEGAERDVTREILIDGLRRQVGHHRGVLAEGGTVPAEVYVRLLGLSAELLGHPYELSMGHAPGPDGEPDRVHALLQRRQALAASEAKDAYA